MAHDDGLACNSMAQDGYGVSTYSDEDVSDSGDFREEERVVGDGSSGLFEYSFANSMVEAKYIPFSYSDNDSENSGASSDDIKGYDSAVLSGVKGYDSADLFGGQDAPPLPVLIEGVVKAKASNSLRRSPRDLNVSFRSIIVVIIIRLGRFS